MILSDDALAGTALFEIRASSPKPKSPKRGVNLSSTAIRDALDNRVKEFRDKTNNLLPKTRDVDVTFSKGIESTRERMRKLTDVEDNGVANGMIHGDEILESFLSMKHDVRVLQTFFRDNIMKVRTTINNSEEAVNYYYSLEKGLIDFENKFDSFHRMLPEEQVKECIDLNQAREYIIHKMSSLLLKELGVDDILTNDNNTNNTNNNSNNKNSNDDRHNTLDWNSDKTAVGTREMIKLIRAVRTISEKASRLESKINFYEADGTRRNEADLRDQLMSLDQQLLQTKDSLAQSRSQLESLYTNYNILANEPGRMQALSKQQSRIEQLELREQELSKEVSKIMTENRELIQSEGQLKDRVSSLHATLRTEKEMYEYEVASLKPEVQKQLMELREKQRDMRYIKHGLTLTVDRFNVAEDKLAASEKKKRLMEEEMRRLTSENSMLEDLKKKSDMKADKQMRMALAACGALESEEKRNSECRDEIARLQRVITDKEADIISLRKKNSNLQKAVTQTASANHSVHSQLKEARQTIHERAAESLAHKSQLEQLREKYEKVSSKDGEVSPFQKVSDELEEVKKNKKLLEHQEAMAMNHIYMLTEKLKDLGVNEEDLKYHLETFQKDDDDADDFALMEEDANEEFEQQADFRTNSTAESFGEVEVETNDSATDTSSPVPPSSPRLQSPSQSLGDLSAA